MSTTVTYAAYRAAQAVKRLDGTEGEDEIAAMLTEEIQQTLVDASRFVLQELGDDASEAAIDLRRLSPEWVDDETRP